MNENGTLELRWDRPEKFGWKRRPDLGKHTWESPDGALFQFASSQQEILCRVELPTPLPDRAGAVGIKISPTDHAE